MKKSLKFMDFNLDGLNEITIDEMMLDEILGGSDGLINDRAYEKYMVKNKTKRNKRMRDSSLITNIEQEDIFR